MSVVACAGKSAKEQESLAAPGVFAGTAGVRCDVAAPVEATSSETVLKM
jgi:hypothetical protein